MAGRIAYAELEYKSPNQRNLSVLRTPTLQRRKNQSERAFVKSVVKLLDANRPKGVLNIGEAAPSAVFFDRTEGEVRGVMEVWREIQKEERAAKAAKAAG